MPNTVILTARFDLVRTTTYHLCNLTLFRDIFVYERVSHECGISCSRQTSSCLVKVHDIYGAKVLKNNDTVDTTAYFQIFACPTKKKGRKCNKMCFRVSEFDDVQSNLRRAREWVRAISWLVTDPSVSLSKIQGEHFLKHYLI